MFRMGRVSGLGTFSVRIRICRIVGCSGYTLWERHCGYPVYLNPDSDGGWGDARSITAISRQNSEQLIRVHLHTRRVEFSEQLHLPSTSVVHRDV